MDRDHAIKCTTAGPIRTTRHNGVVNAIMQQIDRSRNAHPIVLDDGLKPDIEFNIGIARYCIDVNFSIERERAKRYKEKKDKYQREYTRDRVLPVIIGYDGIIIEQSIIDLREVPEIDIAKLYGAIYYHIAWA